MEPSTVGDEWTKLKEKLTQDLAQLTKDKEALQEELEEHYQRSDEGVLGGDNLRVRLTRAIGFFTKGPTEMIDILSCALHVALKDPEFKKKHDELKAASRKRTLDSIHFNVQVKRLDAAFSEAVKDVAALEKQATSDSRVAPDALAQVRAKLDNITQERKKLGLDT